MFSRGVWSIMLVLNMGETDSGHVPMATDGPDVSCYRPSSFGAIGFTSAFTSAFFGAEQRFSKVRF
jgi:hypothetical protein